MTPEHMIASVYFIPLSFSVFPPVIRDGYRTWSRDMKRPPHEIRVGDFGYFLMYRCIWICGQLRDPGPHHMPCLGAEVNLGLTLAKCKIREAVASLREMNFC